MEVNIKDCKMVELARFIHDVEDKGYNVVINGYNMNLYKTVGEEDSPDEEGGG